MPIISTIGRKHWTIRILLGSIYAGLTIGALTMLYPFGLMIAGSTKSAVDTPDPELIPRYLVDDGALWKKHAEAVFNESYELARSTFDTDALTFRDLPAPSAPHPGLTDLWLRFLEETPLPDYSYVLGHLEAPRSRGVLPLNLRRIKERMAERYGENISDVNQALGTEFVGWNAVYLKDRPLLTRMARSGNTPLEQLIREFAAERPAGERVYLNLDGFYRDVFLAARYSRDLDAYNQKNKTQYKTWSDIRLARRLSDITSSSDIQRREWEEFVRNIINPCWVRVDESAFSSYRDYLRGKYKKIGALNLLYKSDYSDWSDILPPGNETAGGLQRADWNSWIEGWTDPETNQRYRVPLESITINNVVFLFQDWLQEQFSSLDVFRNALATPASSETFPERFSWQDVMPPQQDLYYLELQKNTSEMRKEYSLRNFVTVVDYIVLHGRGVWNTVVYCLLAILSSLIVNPLAAYALSRYRPPSQYKILLFLMLTMAFPPMVTQIPVFLMLRELNLLNTFAALVLPGLANGYSIFLLKGFFDSLPRELYESAEIDGAGEFRIFWQITMSLSKPILAVIALNAFNMAYSNFMMALLICQDEKMWTLMPWLYQLQNRSGEGVIFASLLVAAVPTLIIFAFCQNVIMRGIVVPVEK